MSIIIGCVAGILIFIFIIISIVMNRDVEKDDEPEDEDSMTGSHKSPRPSAKTNRSDSLTCTPNQRNMSRNNSQSSSLLNRISLAEAAGPDALPPRVNRNSTGGPGSASGTLKRGSNTIVNSNSLSRSQQSRDINAQVISIMALDLSKRPRRGRFWRPMLAVPTRRKLICLVHWCTKSYYSDYSETESFFSVFLVQ